MNTDNPLTIFIAMPYTDFGDKAKWKKPENVETFYRAVAARIEQDQDTEPKRKVLLQIEKYRAESGLVHESMFRAARDADVFIADLTGANANVFFELGVRFGLSRAVTILTSQDDATPYDVSQMRLVRYANRPDELVFSEISNIAVSGLRRRQEELDYTDSPVLKMLQLEVVERARWQRVAGIRVKMLLDAAADKRLSPDKKLELLEQAVDDDPFSLRACLGLVNLLRSRQDYGSGLKRVDSALMRFPKSHELHKERGLILDRMSQSGDNRTDEAIESYRTALYLNENDTLNAVDPDLLCCLGGILRRKGVKNRDQTRTECLQESLSRYQQAVVLQRHSSYAGLNVLRARILIDGEYNQNSDDLQQHVKRMYHLCAFEKEDSLLSDKEERWWSMFDLGDTLVFSKETDQALEVYDEAINSIPKSLRGEKLISPKRTWEELIQTGALKQDMLSGAETLLELIEKGISTSKKDGIT